MVEAPTEVLAIPGTWLHGHKGVPDAINPGPEKEVQADQDNRPSEAEV